MLSFAFLNFLYVYFAVFRNQKRLYVTNTNLVDLLSLSFDGKG